MLDSYGSGTRTDRPWVVNRFDPLVAWESSYSGGEASNPYGKEQRESIVSVYTPGGDIDGIFGSCVRGDIESSAGKVPLWTLVLDLLRTVLVLLLTMVFGTICATAGSRDIQAAEVQYDS